MGRGTSRTNFKKGNQAARKYTKENVAELMDKVVELAYAQKPLSIQALLVDNREVLSLRQYNYLMENFRSIMGPFREELEGIIVASINEGALDGTYKSGPAIWRMKQCGERDETYVEQTNVDLEVVIE